MGLAGVEDDGQVQAAGQADVFPEDLVLGAGFGGAGQVVQANLADADHLGAGPGQSFQLGISLLVDGLVGIGGVDADASVEDAVLAGHADAGAGGVRSGAGQDDELHRRGLGPLDDPGDLRGGVLVEMGVGIAEDDAGRGGWFRWDLVFQHGLSSGGLGDPSLHSVWDEASTGFVDA